MSCTRTASRLAMRLMLGSALALVVLLCVVPSVFAAPGDPLTVVTVTPAEATIVTDSAMPTISVLVDGGTAPLTGVIKIDGVNQPVIADVSGLSFSYKPGNLARLQDGTHTVEFTATDSLGASVSSTWQFQVQILPTISSNSPTLNEIITNRRPSVYFTVYDNSLAATYTITVDGVRLSFLNSSGYEANWGGYYGIQGYQVTDLANGVHTAYARITDPGGHTVEKTWTFVVYGEIVISGSGIADGQIYTTAQPAWHFLGKDTYSTPVNYSLYVDGSQISHTTSYQYSNGNHDLDVTSTPSSPLSDGPHTVMPMFWDMKMSQTKSFNIQIQAPPTVFHLRPSKDGIVTTTTPTLTARATDNSTSEPTFAFLVDGVPVSSDPVRTIATSRWEGTAKVTTPLSTNATHTVSVTVSDASGYATTRTWEIFVARTAVMSHYDSGACTDCHGNPYYVHAANGGDAIVWNKQYACNLCHSVFPDHATYGWYTKPMVAAQIDNPSTFIPNPFKVNTCACHSAGHPYYNNQTNCRNCHDRVNTINEQGEPPSGRGETDTLAAETRRHAIDGDFSRCTECHQADLVVEHAGRLDSLGATMTCQTCHASANTTVTAAIAAGDSRCGSCHTGDMAASPAHNWDAAPKVNYQAACTKCHWPNYTHYVRYQGDTCGGRRCHRSWPALTYWYMPTAVTSSGRFSSAASVNATSGALHRIHVNGSWIAKYLNDSKCESCHGAAGCAACHSDPGHASHGPAPSAPETYMAAFGATNTGYLQVNTTNIVGDDVAVTSGCSAAGCHVRSKAGTVAFKPACADCH